MDAPYDPESPLYNPESPLSLHSDHDGNFSLDDEKEALDSSLGSKKECARKAVATIFESRKKEDVLSGGDESNITTVSSKSAKFVPAFKENNVHLEENTVKIVAKDADHDHHHHRGSADEVNGFELKDTNKEKPNQEKADDENIAKTHETILKKNSASKLHDSPKKHESKDRKRKEETENDRHSEDDHHEKKKHKKKKKDHFSKSPERTKITKSKEKYSKMDKKPSEKHVDNSLLSSKKRISESKSTLAEISESGDKKKNVHKEKEKSVTQNNRKERNSMSDKSDRNKEMSHTASKTRKDLAVNKSLSEKKERHTQSKAKEASKPRETPASKVERKHSTRDENRESSKKVSKRKREHSHQRSSSSDSESTQRKRYKHSEKSEDKKKKEKDEKSKNDKKKHKKVHKEVEEDDDNHRKHRRKSDSTERTHRRSHSSSKSKHKKKKHSDTEKKDRSKPKHKKHHTKDKRSRSPEHHSKSKKHTSEDKSKSKTRTNENKKIAESHTSPKKPLAFVDSIGKKKEEISNVIVFDGSNHNSSHKNDSNTKITPAIETKSEQLIGLRVYNDDEQDDMEENGRKCVESAEENKEMIMVDEDTDSEFERLSDLEKEIEKEKQLLNKELKSKDNVNDDVKEIQESSNHENLSQNGDGNKVGILQNSVENSDISSPTEVAKDKCNKTSVLDDDGSLDQICSPETIEEMLEAKINCDVIDEKVEAGELKKNEVSQNAEKISNSIAKSEEKRTFKLFSKEETHRLDEELRGVEERSTDDEETMSETINEDDQVDEAVSKENEPSILDNNVSKDKIIEEKRSQDNNVIKEEPDLKTSLRKTKDDLFDDIFSQEDQLAKENDGFAKVLGHGDSSDTSPKLTSPILLKSSLDTKIDDVSMRESKMSTDSKKDKEESTDTKTEDLDIDIKKEIIPGLELSSIPGLDIKDESQIKIAGELCLQDSPRERKKLDKSKIPLLFDTDSSPDKALVGKSPDQLTPDEQGFKRPHTPPGEFTGDAEASQFESYYHIESENDSPYNPEDQSIMEIDLSPIDQSILKQDVLRETVQLRLKDPFSGFENPTWEKIIKAKSKQEAVRHKRKKEESKKSAHRHRSNINYADTKNKPDKMVDYLVRQSRVEQECKVILKQYYKSKDITKEEYKMIMRKAVPQVTMSNSPIIPEKIRSLIKKFVGKCKGQRLLETKSREKEKPRNHSSAAYSQGLTLPGEQRFRYLNSDLPMPPF